MDKLKTYYDVWANAQIETSEYITPDDGKYRVIIDDVSYSDKDKAGNETYPTFIYSFTITEGNLKGQRFRRYSSIRNEKSAGFVKGDLMKLGMPIPANVEELPELFRSAAGTIIDVNVKTREVNGKPYKDIYIDRLINRQQPKPTPQPQPVQYMQQRQFTDARAQPPQGFFAQPPQYQQPQPQAFGAGYNQDDEIPF